MNGYNSTNSNSTHDSMPDLVTDSDIDFSDDDNNSDHIPTSSNSNNTNDTNEEKEDDHITKDKCTNITTIDNSIIDNNLLFTYQKIGIGKTYISGASAYPPELSSNITLGAQTDNGIKITNKYIDGNIVDYNKSKLICNQPKVEITNLIDINNFISDTSITLESKSDSDSKDSNDVYGTINSVNSLQFIDNELNHVITGDNTIIIPTIPTSYFGEVASSEPVRRWQAFCFQPS